MIFWIGPNAKRLSTKNVIAKQISVQIISPGIGVRSESASGRVTER